MAAAAAAFESQLSIFLLLLLLLLTSSMSCEKNGKLKLRAFVDSVVVVIVDVGVVKEE